MRSFLTLVLLSLFSVQTLAQEGKIYFVSGRTDNERQKQIGVIKPDGSGYREVTFRASSRSEYQPHVSADGQKMTFNTYRYGGWKVAIADSDGKNVSKLTRDNAYEYDASWSPDGKKIVMIGFERGNTGKRQLFLVDASTKTKTQLTDEDYSHYRPTFINNDKLLFAATKGKQFDIYTLDLKSSKTENLTDSPDIHEFAPALSPDGAYLAYHQVNEQDEVSLHVLDLETGNYKVIYTGWKSREKLPESESPLFSYSISWSPSGQHLVFASYFGNHNFELMLIGKDGKGLKRLTNTPKSDIQPHWAR